jgi:hypothetical protein
MRPFDLFSNPRHDPEARRVHPVIISLPPTRLPRLRGVVHIGFLSSKRIFSPVITGTATYYWCGLLLKLSFG